MGRTNTATTPEGHMIRFQCHHCPYSSPNKHNLMLHINSHRGHRPYQCSYCPYAASQPSTVRTHTRVRHRDRCKYKCIHCEFYCQKERAISLHLERYHSITTYSIATYMNSSFVDDQYAAPSDGISVLKGRPSIYDRQARMSSLMNSSTNVKPEYLKGLNMENMLALHQNLANRGPPPKMQILNSSSDYSAIMDYTAHQQQEKAKLINNNGVKQNTPAQPMDTSAPLDCSVKQSPSHDSEPEVADPLEMMSNDMESHYECDQCDYACAYESQFIKHLMTMHKDSGIVVVDPSQEGSLEYPAIDHEAANSSIADQSENGLSSNCNTSNGTDTNSHSADTAKDSGYAKIGPTKLESHTECPKHTEYPKLKRPQDNGCLEYANANNFYVNSNIAVSQSFEVTVPNKMPFIKTEANILPEHINGTHNPSRQQDPGSGSSNRIPSKRKMLNPVQRLDRSRASPNQYQPDTSSPPAAATPTNTLQDQATQTNNHAMENLRQKQEQFQFICPHCKIIFPDNLLFVIHRGSHGYNDPFQCNMCGYKAIDKYEFTTHIHGCPLTKPARD